MVGEPHQLVPTVGTSTALARVPAHVWKGAGCAHQAFHARRGGNDIGLAPRLTYASSMARPLPRSWQLALRVFGLFCIGLVLIYLLGRLFGSDVTEKPLNHVGVLASLIGIFLALGALTASIGSETASTPEHVERIKSQLRSRVHERWSAERAARRLNAPTPLQIRWTEADPVLTARPKAIVGDTVGGHPKALRLRGLLREAVDKYELLPYRQLVVLGAPGSGKSVYLMLMALEMLERPAPGDFAVPIILPLGSWNPKSSPDIWAWIESRIVREYPNIFRTRHDAQILHQLLQTSQILPMLDGLDEMPLPLRGSAVDALRQQITPERQLILACRLTEYSEVVAEYGPLATAAAIKLDTVPVDAAMDYLMAARPADGPTSWRPVADEARPGSPVADALKTPLMVGLARAVYERTHKDPSELTNKRRFPDASTVERHLVSAYVPSRYGLDADTVNAKPQPEDSSDLRRYRQHDRWRRFIASRMLHSDTPRELEWWSIAYFLPRTRTRIAFVAFCGAVGFIVGWTVYAKILHEPHPILVGDLSGIATATASAIPAFFGTLPGPPVLMRARFEWDGGRTEAVRSGMAIGLPCALITGVVGAVSQLPWQSTLTYTVLALAIAGVFAAVVRWSYPTERTLAPSPKTILRTDGRSTIIRACIVFIITTLVLVGLFSYAYGAGVDAVVGALIVGSFLALGAVLSCPWSWYQIANVCFFLRRQMPFPLMRFLEDDYNRDVLRQVGSVYQFRHAVLQDYLASEKR
jgi:hypothetical protein